MSNLNVSTIQQIDKPTRIRYLMLILIMFGTAINYLDRSNFAVAAPFIKDELGLTPMMLGVLFSAFSWAYTPMQLPGGYLLDRFGPRLVYGIAVLGWSLCTLFIGFSTTFTVLIIARVLIGFFEAPAFPSNGRVVTAWFPANERGTATACFIGAQYIGLAFCTPVITWIISRYNWPAAFFICGIIGLFLVAVWFTYYRDPGQSKLVNRAELDLISQGGGLSDSVKEQNKITLKQFAHLFKYRQLWGMYIGKFAVGTTNNFFTNWFPAYLIMEKHLTILKMGFYAAIPFIGAIAGVLISGRISDWLLSRGCSIAKARNIPTVTGLLLSCFVMSAAYIDNINFIIVVLTIAYFGQAAAGGVAFALLSDIAPRELVGMSNAMLNFAATLGGISCPLIIGFIVTMTHSFTLALIYIGIVSLIAALAYICMVRNVRRIEITD